jgi:hypothetical protein
MAQARTINLPLIFAISLGMIRILSLEAKEFSFLLNGLEFDTIRKVKWIK